MHKKKRKDIPLRRNQKMIKETVRKSLIGIKLMDFINIKKNET